MTFPILLLLKIMFLYYILEQYIVGKLQYGSEVTDLWEQTVTLWIMTWEGSHFAVNSGYCRRKKVA